MAATGDRFELSVDRELGGGRLGLVSEKLCQPAPPSASRPIADCNAVHGQPVLALEG
jgi:hypothetical protein